MHKTLGFEGVVALSRYANGATVPEGITNMPLSNPSMLNEPAP